jgi:hypothetical protein
MRNYKIVLEIIKKQKDAQSYPFTECPDGVVA